MPVFDFECRNCRQKFSELISGAEQVLCPHCGAAEPRKLFSGFHTISDATRWETGAADLPSMTQWEKARRVNTAETEQLRKARRNKKREKVKRLSMKDLKPRAAVHKRRSPI